MLNVQLPPAASLRADGRGAARRSRRSSAQTEGRRDVQHDRRLQPADARLAPATTASTSSRSSRGTSDGEPSLDARAIVDRAERGSFAPRCPEAIAFAFMPPSIPGLGTAGRLLVLAAGPQRRHRSSSSNENLQKFLEAARKRPELAGVDVAVLAPRCRRSTPTSIATRCSSRASRVGDVYQTLQAFLGGLYVNQFNRFGRQWRVFLQAEGDGAHDARRHRPVLRAQQRRRHGAAVDARDDAADVSARSTRNRFNVYRAAQVTGAAGARLQLGPGAGRARRGGEGRRCRARWATTGPTSRTRSSKAAGTRGDGRSRCRSSSCS